MKRKIALLILPLVASLSCNNMLARPNNNGFIAGACAVGGALLAAAGAVALVEWCCSETDDQLIARIDRQSRALYAQHKDAMGYFYDVTGIDPFSKDTYQIRDIRESALYEFGTYVWNKNISQYDYRLSVMSAKNALQSCVQDLRKRIHYLEEKSCNYEEQKALTTMRKLLNSTENLLADVTLFADSLEYHKTYFRLYDSVGKIYNRYLTHITLLDSYYNVMEIKRYILNNDSSQFAFRTFVKAIESDIQTVQSDLHYTSYNYEFGRKYANKLIGQLTTIKNIVVNDPRYQQELYEWEQARLERQRIEAREAQARLERDRINILKQQNRILEEQNRIEREKLYYGRHVVAAPCVEEISLTICL